MHQLINVTFLLVFAAVVVLFQRVWVTPDIWRSICLKKGIVKNERYRVLRAENKPSIHQAYRPNDIESVIRYGAMRLWDHIDALKSSQFIKALMVILHRFLEVLQMISPQSTSVLKE